MGEWEEKLNSILEDSDAMGQIMALARSLTGGLQEETGAEKKEQEADVGSLAQPDLSDWISQLDPELLRKGMGIVRGLQEKDDRSKALLVALKPFLRKERQEQIDRAVQAIQLTRILRLALGTGGRKEDEGV